MQTFLLESLKQQRPYSHAHQSASNSDYVRLIGIKGTVCALFEVSAEHWSHWFVIATQKYDMHMHRTHRDRNYKLIFLLSSSAKLPWRRRRWRGGRSLSHVFTLLGSSLLLNLWRHCFAMFLPRVFTMEVNHSSFFLYIALCTFRPKLPKLDLSHQQQWNRDVQIQVSQDCRQDGFNQVRLRRLQPVSSLCCWRLCISGSYSTVAPKSSPQENDSLSTCNIHVIMYTESFLVPLHDSRYSGHWNEKCWRIAAIPSLPSPKVPEHSVAACASALLREAAIVEPAFRSLASNCGLGMGHWVGHPWSSSTKTKGLPKPPEPAVSKFLL